MANSTCILIHLSPPFFFGSLSFRRTLLSLASYYLISSSWRYIPSLCIHFLCHVLLCVFTLSLFFFFLHVYLFLLPALTSTILLSLPLFFF